MKTLTTSKSFLNAKSLAPKNIFRSVIASSKSSVLLMFLAMILIGTTSCSRGSGYGCGTWPTLNGKYGTQYRSDSWPVKTKQNSGPQYANYKRYN